MNTEGQIESAEGNSQSASSRSSSTGSQSTNGAQALISATFFPFFTEVDYTWPQKMVLFGFLVETFQLFGFVVSPLHWGWGGVVSGIGTPLYFLHLPIWDASYPMHAPYTAMSVVFWIVFTTIVFYFLVVAVIVRFVVAMEQVDPRLTVTARCLMASLGGVFFIPAMHVFLSLSTPWAYPDHPPWSNLNAAHFVAAVIGLFCLVANAMISNCIVYHDHPKTIYFTGRAHSRVEEAVIAYKVLLTVLYHALRQHPQVYAALVCVTSLVMALLHAFVLPFYRHVTNRIRILSLSLLSYAAFLVTLKIEYGPSDTDMTHTNWDVLYLVIGGLIVTLFANYMASVRINRECITLLTLAQNGEPVDNQPEFPRNLPRGERTPIRELEGFFFDPFSVPNEDDDVTVVGSAGVACSYLSCVYTPSDIEVSTRFLQSYTNTTGLYPKPLMIAFALRIFSKGSVKFNESHLVPYHYSCFLAYFTINRLQAALGVLDIMQRQEMSQAMYYRVFRMSSTMKTALGVRDNAQKKILQTALRMHLDALTNITIFWSRLLSKQVEGAALANVAKMITERREEGYRQFERLVTDHTDHNIMSRYAVFLEEIMMDREASANCREIICDELGAKQRKNSPEENKKTQTTMHQNQKRSISSAIGSLTIHRLRSNMNSMFLVLFLCLSGLMVFGIVISTAKSDAIHAMHYAGEARMVSQKCAYLADELLRQVVVEKEYVVCSTQSSRRESGECVSSHVEAVRAELRLAIATYRSAQNLLTKGTYKSSYAPHRELFRSGFFMVTESAPTGLWLLGTQLAAALESIASDGDNRGDIDFIRANVHGNVARAFNASLAVYETESADLLHSATVAFILLYLASLSVIVVVYFILKLNFQKIGAAKLATLSLFTLIPTVELEKLHEDSLKRTQTFGEPDAILAKMKQDRGIEVNEEGGENDVQRRNNKHKDKQKEADEEVPQLTGKFTAMKNNIDKVDFGARRKKSVPAGGEEISPTEELAVVEEPTVVAAPPETYTAGDHLKFLADKDDDIQFDVVVPTSEKVSVEKVSAKSTTNTLFYLVCGVTMGCVGALALTLLAQAALPTAHREVTSATSERQLVVDQVEALTSLRFRAENFVNMGDMPRFVEYFSESLFLSLSQRSTQLYELENDHNVFRPWAVSHAYEERLVELMAIAVRLAAAGHGIANKTEIDALYETLEWNRTALLTNLDDTYFRPPLLDISDTATDMAKTPSEQLLAARGLLFGDWFDYLMNIALSALDEMTEMLESRALANVAIFVNYTSVVIACACVVFLASVCIAVRADMKENSVGQVLMYTVAACALACVIICGMSYNVATAITDAHTSRIHVISQINATRQTLRATLHSARVFALNGDPLALDRYLEIVSSNALPRLVSEMRRVDLLRDGAHYDHFSQVEYQWQQSYHLSQIAVSLSCWANNVPCKAYSWDITTESHYEVFRLTYPSREMYSSPSQDTLLPKPNQTDTAIHIAFGERFEDTLGSILRLLNEISRGMGAAGEVEMTNLFDDAQMLTSLCTFFAACGLFLFCMYGYLYAHSQLQLSGDGKSDSLFEDLTRKSRLALALITFTITGVLVLVMVDLARSQDMIANLNASSKREFVVAQSLVVINRMTTTNGNNKHLQPATTNGNDIRARHAYHLKFLASEMGTVRDRFYFGKKGKEGYSAVGSDAAQDLILFGTHTDAARRGTCTPGGSALGVDVASRRWEDVMKYVQTADMNKVSAILPSLYEMGSTVISGLRNSTIQYETQQLDEVDFIQTIYIIIVSVTLVIFLMENFFVFRPMLQLLLNEEEGTKLMLRMIPLEVRDAVPAIAEYLETGVITQDKKVQAVNDAITELSTVPTISIDFKGTVLSFSRAAEEAFMYEASEVIGKNIKMLQPESIAREHDSYLSTYRRSGIRHVIGKARTSRAMRKDGTLFPIEITVREFKFGKETTFIGCVRNISIDIDFERANLLSNAVSEAATVPIICINTKGIILRFNVAAEQTFMCKAQEVLGYNVKMLMPASTADVHDGFLAEYLRTGVKHVIDKRRQIKARRRATGELFHAIVSVRELKENGVYIGYVEDQTREYHLQLASMVNEAISTTSPTPLVSMNISGIVLSWNPAAAATFGFSADEMVMKPIKAIMLENVSMKHDQYLLAYQRTGRKKVIDAVTEQKARRREDNGSFTTLSVSLSVKEIKQRNKPQTFVAYIQNMTGTQQLLLESRISGTITNLSAIPIIMIDVIGSILNFSEAALQKWGYTRSEIIGKNIKILMPSHIAANHDEYLANYLKTGVRSIIDTIRRLPAVKKNGVEFPVEISVKEVKIGDMRTYVGFVRDVTQELTMTQANATNDAITQLSVVPIFVLNTKGIIQACSDSSVEKFGYAREEMIGSNIKMLMPDKIANNHDGYLERYVALREQHGDKAMTLSTVVNKRRRVTGKTRDDVCFPVEIQVCEIFKEGVGSIYVGLVTDLTEEIELKTSRVIAETMIEASTLPVVSITRFGLVRIFNKAAETQFGWSRNEVLGKNISMLMPEGIAMNHDGYLKAYAKTGVRTLIGKKSVLQAREKNGNLFSVEVFVNEVVETDAYGGKTPIFLGFMRDLTQQMQLEQTTMISEVVSELSTTPILVINSKGTVQEYNQAASRDFGFEASEVIGHNIKMLMPEEVSKNHDGYLQRYVVTREKRVVDAIRSVTGRRKNGEIFPASISVREVRKDGLDSTFIGYVKDLTQQHEIESQKNYNETIIDLSVIPIIGITMKGSVGVFSRAAQEAFGYQSEEVVGKNLKMLMPDEIAIKHDQYLRAYEKTGVKHIVDSSKKTTAKHKDGTIFPVDISVKETTISGGEKTFIGYVRSIAREQQFEYEKSIGQLLLKMCPTPVVVIDINGIITALSHSAEAELQYMEAEMVGRNVTMINDIAWAKIANQEPRRIYAFRKDKTKILAELLVKEIKTATEKPFYMGFIRNIGLEVSVSDASKISDAVTKNSPMAIVSITSTGSIRMFNPAAEKLLGYTEAEVMGKNVKMLMPEEVAVKHDEILETFARTGVRNVIGRPRIISAQHKDGSHVIIEFFLSVMIVPGLDNTFVAYMRDVKKDNMLLFTTQVNESITSLISMPVISIDHMGTLLTMSESALEAFQYTLEETIGQNIKMLTPPNIAAQHDEFLARYQRTGEKRVVDTKRQVRAMRKDGTQFPAEICVKEFMSTAGTSVFVGFVRDTINDNFTERLQIVLDTTMAGLSRSMLSITADGTIREAHGEAQLFGCEREALLCKSIHDMIPNAYDVSTSPEMEKFYASCLPPPGVVVVGVYHNNALKSWQKISDREVVVRTYALFEVVPKIKDKDIVFMMEDFLANFQTHPDAVTQRCREGGVRHAGDGALVEAYPVVGVALVSTLKAILTPMNEWTNEVEKGLMEAYATMARLMVQGQTSPDGVEAADIYLTVVSHLEAPNVSPDHDVVDATWNNKMDKHQLVLDFYKNLAPGQRMCPVESFISAIDYVVNSVVTEPEVVASKVREMGARHMGHGATEALYHAACHAFLLTLKQQESGVLGEEVENAWSTFLKMVTRLLMEGVQTLEGARVRKTMIRTTTARRVIAGQTGTPLHVITHECPQEDGPTTFVVSSASAELDVVFEFLQAETNTILELMAYDAVVTTDRCGVILFANDAVMSLFEVSEPLLGVNITSLVPDGFMEQYDVQRTVTSVKGLKVMVTVREVQDEGGDPIYVGVFRAGV